MGEFEVQVLDSYENPTYSDGSAGAIYGQYPPLVNASRKPGEWQTYDIVFLRPRFDKQGDLTKPARLTVFHNGVLIQNGNEALGPTNWIRYRAYEKMASKIEGPLSLQDHGNPVRYRNIWVRNLAEPESPKPPLGSKPPHDLKPMEIDRLVGQYGGHRVMASGNGLVFMFNGNTPISLIANGPTSFEFKESKGTLEFKTDDQGEVLGIKFQLDAAGNRSAKRNN